MTDAKTLQPLAQTLATFLQTADTLPETERKQAAEHLIEEIKSLVAQGAGLSTAYEYVQQLTPSIEPAAKAQEALNYRIWMELRRSHIPPALPTAAQREQIGAYSKASDQVIDEVLKTVEGEEEQHALIEERLSALRKHIFGVEEPQFLFQISHTGL